ncbi:hypothetical protein [Streptomyces virginiae]|uniref:hypothetical protein n=1 Tax=Streptomyces virginiae TaxID=1961 RepID=UPI0022525BD0|nr:hypothetical protein [Streptomyces virginiae]MCX5175804.1 hypothetical protein [Streptomyces virginiae]
MKRNDKMSRLLAEFPVGELTADDVPPMFREVAAEGWSYTPNGARVLSGLVPELTRSYGDVLQEETSINGRGMTDHDLPAAESERSGPLLRRCLAYAFACLVEAERRFGDQDVRAYLILSLGGANDDLLTATVTFCTHQPNAAPYVRDIENVQDAAVAELTSSDRGSWR